MSYKIEYLISKAFTPIVPSNNYMNEISKISWNNKHLLDNISCSGITDSILMGRNPSLGGTNPAESIEKQSRNRSHIWQSSESMNQKAIKTPQIRGNRVKQPLQYHRSMTNEQNTISSIVGTTRKNFPPIGFGNQEPSDEFMDSNLSKRRGSSQNLIKSNGESSIMSPIPFEKKYFGKAHIQNMNLNNKNSNRLLNHSRRLNISENNEIRGFTQDALNGSRTFDRREPIIVKFNLFIYRNIHQWHLKWKLQDFPPHRCILIAAVNLLGRMGQLQGIIEEKYLGRK